MGVELEADARRVAERDDGDARAAGTMTQAGDDEASEALLGVVVAVRAAGSVE